MTPTSAPLITNSPHLVDRLDVECTHLHTVPNHVHLLRLAGRNTIRQSSTWDSQARRCVSVRPPLPKSSSHRPARVSCARWRHGGVFLAAPVLAARSPRTARHRPAFLLGQAISVLVMAHVAWQPHRALWKPLRRSRWRYPLWRSCCFQAGARWLVAGVLGALHGLYFHLFVQTTSTLRAGVWSAGRSRRR